MTAADTLGLPNRCPHCDGHVTAELSLAVTIATRADTGGIIDYTGTTSVEWDNTPTIGTLCTGCGREWFDADLLADALTQLDLPDPATDPTGASA